MSDADRRSLVEQFRPNERDEKVLNVLKDASPASMKNKEICERVGLTRWQLAATFDRLVTAGWIERVKRGHYRLVEDPRSVWEKRQQLRRR